MRTRLLIPIAIIILIAIIFASIYYSDLQQREYIGELREEQKNIQLLKMHQKYCDKTLETSQATFIDAPRWKNATHWFETPSCTFNKIGLGITMDRTIWPYPEDSQFVIHSDHQEYIENCNATLHKTTLPDVKIETDEQWYDLQYCMWRPHYPDLSHIEDKDLMNNNAYCVELFNTLYDFHTAPGPNCGLQRYNEDGTPRAICEPKPFGSSLSNDDNLKNNTCKENYKDWAHLTKDDDMVHTLYGDWLAPKLNLFTSKPTYALGDDVYIEGRIRNVAQDYATVLIEIPYNQEIHQDIFTIELDERGKFQHTFHIDARWDEGRYDMKVIDPQFDEIISFGVK